MTVLDAVPAVSLWREPAGIAPRGTVIVVPGRGEHPGVYERFGRRISADGYRVWGVADPTGDETRTTAQVRGLLRDDPAGETGPEPRVLVGTDAGALFAAGLVAGGAVGDAVAGLILVGLPSPVAGPGPATWDAADWNGELDARTSCPTHRTRLSADDGVRRGALGQRLRAAWFDRADPAAIGVPVLGVHGAADVVSPLAAIRPWYAALPAAELVTLAGGRHDALNDQTHRTAAATVVLFLERLRLGADTPALATTERLR